MIKTILILCYMKHCVTLYFNSNALFITFSLASEDEV